jgi:Uma2 family endonuclease
MSAEPVDVRHPLLDHDGPWTEADYLSLPEIDGWKVELIDGDLLMSPIGQTAHQRIVMRLGIQLDAQLNGDIEVLPGVNAHLEEDRILIPDVVVLRIDDRLLVPPEDIVLACEVVSKWGKARDRILKRALYGEAKIPWYLLVEQEPRLELILLRCKRSGYVEHARAVEGEVLEIPDLGVSIDVDGLLRRKT